MNNKGEVLLETVISIGFVSVLLLSSFIVINNIIQKNSKLYNDKIERKTINLVYSKIANDMYRYNIDSYYECDNNVCSFDYYDKKDEFGNIISNSGQISITEEGLKYNNQLIKNNSAVTFNSIIFSDEDNILTVSITYNDDKIMNIYSINYKG